MNPKETFYSGKKDGKRHAKIFSNEFKAIFDKDSGISKIDNFPVARSSYESDNEATRESHSSDSQDEDSGNDKWDLHDTIRESFAASITLAEIECKNCGHTIHEDQMYCDECCYKLKFECVGKINGKPCHKVISSESKFCANCGTANVGMIKESQMKICCKRCGHEIIYQTQNFCGNCGNKIEDVCLGKIDGHPCSKPINSEVRFCSNCGTTNPGFIKGSLHSKSGGEKKYYVPSEESIMRLVSMGFTREKSIESLQCTGGKVEEAADWLLSCTDHYDVEMRKKPTLSDAQFQSDIKDKRSSLPSYESVMKSMAMGYTVHSLGCSGGKVEDAADSRLSCPVHDHVEMRKKPTLSEVQFETKWKEQPSFRSSTESVTDIVSLGVTEEQAIDALTPTEGNEEDAVIRLVSHPVLSDVTLQKKEAFSEGSLHSKSGGEKKYSVPSEESIMRLVSMGFTMEKSIESLQCTGGKVEEAADWLLNCTDHYDVEMRKKPTLSDAQFQSYTKDTRSSLPSYESVMKSTAMGYTRNQEVQSLECSGVQVEDAADSRLSRPVHDHVEMRKKPTLSEVQFQTQWKEQPSMRSSTQSVIDIMSLGFTEEQAIDALTSTDGNEEDAVIRLVSRPVHSDVILQKKEAFSEEGETRDSDFLELSDEEIQELDEEIKELDEAVIDYFSAPTTNLLPEINDEDDETVIEKGVRKSIENNILHRLKTYGGKATAKFLMLQAMEWKTEKVKIAVAGQSSSGKSSFINAIRGVGHNDKGYAQVGYGDTTLKVETYKHPKNKHILYCDLPGYGTTTITREKFLDKVNISSFDIFIIFFTSVPTTDDDWLVRQLQKARKPFCFVRTKLDQDIENGKRMGENENTVLDYIKDTIARATESMPVLKGADIFIISNPKPFIGDMSNLIKFMQKRVTTVKFEAILFSLPAFTKEIIENKYKDLLGRITNVAYLHAMNYSYVYSSLKENQHKCDDNIKTEITTYFKVFELDSVCAKDVPNLKHYYSDEHIFKLLKIFTDQMPGLGIRLIPIYSVIKKYRVCKQYLTNLLKELKADAYTMYMQITKHGN